MGLRSELRLPYLSSMELCWCGMAKCRFSCTTGKLQVSSWPVADQKYRSTMENQDVGEKKSVLGACVLHSSGTGTNLHPVVVV